MRSSRSTGRKPRSWTAARRPFVAAIDQVGIETLDAPRRYHPGAQAGAGRAAATPFGEFRPYARGFRVEAEIEFDHPLIGRQSLALDVRPDTFRREIARARTFGFMRDVAKLWSAGYALGASLENTLVVTENRVLNPEGPRFPDEFVRHKVLDAIGDLALAGAPAARRLSLGARRPQAQLCGAFGPDGRYQRLDPGRGRAGAAGAAAMPTCGVGLVAPALRRTFPDPPSGLARPVRCRATFAGGLSA